MITTTFSERFYGGTGVTNDVPGLWDAALNGRKYMLDDKHPAFGQGLRTIPLLRTQADTGAEPGEGSINPEDLWSRSATSWHKGAGQRYYDRATSTRDRFWRSFGINPWTKGKLSTLPSVSTLRASASTNLAVEVTDHWVYVADNTEVYWIDYANLGAGWSAANIHAGEASQTVKSLATDGYTVWAALGSNGIHTTTRTAIVSTHYSALTATLVDYVKDRLMAANGRAIYNVTAGGAAPTALFTHPSLDWAWTGFAGGTSYIYAAGYAGDKSTIYKIPVLSTGAGLDVPLVAADLPDGEVVQAICGYMGFLVIGTNNGFRLATQATDGSLTLGSLVSLGNAVKTFEPQGRFVWFGWTNFDGTYTGLGRMDLSTFSDTAALVPAYASDIMSSNQGTVTDAGTVSAVQVFAVQGVGVFVGSGTPVVGWMETGLIGFGIPDVKVALKLPIQHESLAAAAYVKAYISGDDRLLAVVGTSGDTASTAPSVPFTIGQLAAKKFELRLELSNAVLERFDLRAYPTAARGKEILAPLLLHEHVELSNGSQAYFDPLAEYDALSGYVGLSRLVSYQELGATYSVFVEQVQFQRSNIRTDDRSFWNGTALCKLKVLGG